MADVHDSLHGPAGDGEVALIEELIPHVDATYRTIADRREHRPTAQLTC
jgi:enterochelin esterase-like enzyme